MGHGVPFAVAPVAGAGVRRVAPALVPREVVIRSVALRVTCAVAWPAAPSLPGSTPTSFVVALPDSVTLVACARRTGWNVADESPSPAGADASSSEATISGLAADVRSGIEVAEAMAYVGDFSGLVRGSGTTVARATVFSGALSGLSAGFAATAAGTALAASPSSSASLPPPNSLASRPGVLAGRRISP